MLEKNEGFFLPEMLLSLSAWLIIASVFFPLVMNVVNQSVHLQQEFDGTKALYEALLKAEIEGVQPRSEWITINHTVYELYQETSGSHAGLEVCIKYENVSKKQQKKCEIYK